ncbi:short-chain dehydrogenase [Longibacter salinarum]|uniref:Short-chain dehydrogenase n=1 Tax=Longibacter salinarum TaxID=1850348 RepID=A0A2A8CVE4_9BACT|nr:SDR family NAD(P)-dependent oxidoreductase [Longibacter salinarum]PEN12580.1 short-chain dehydrogenase [Longibacter salinarum]
MPTVAITGAAGAIGSVTANVFANAGWTLALLDYGEENGQKLREQFPDAYVYTGDLTNEEEAREVFDSAASEADGIDAVLSIAGGFAMQPAVEASQEDADKMMAMNFQTLFQTARAAIPHLLDQAHGFFLGVSAPAAEDGGAGAALYAASKGAVAAYVKSIDAEYADDGLRASVLYPMGVVDTPDNRDAMPDSDPSTWIAPRELAEGMFHLATRSQRGHIKTLKVHATAS